MARSNRLYEIAVEMGINREEVIPQAIRQHGTVYKAAIALGVYPRTVYYWLETNGWTLEGREWVAPEGDKQPA